MHYRKPSVSITGRQQYSCDTTQKKRQLVEDGILIREKKQSALSMGRVADQITCALGALS
jgi:hypothetical protein